MKNILIFRIGQLGDALVSLPAIKIIRERHRQHRLVLLTDYHPDKDYVSSWETFEPTGWFDEVVFYEPPAALWDSLKETSSLAKRLRALAPEYVYALPPERNDRQLMRDHLFFKYIVGARNYIGPQFSILHGKNPLNDTSCGEPEWRRLIGIIGTEKLSAPFRLHIPESETTRALDVLHSEGMEPGSMLLVLGPGSKMPSKVWPIDRYVELGARLTQTFPELSLVILGGENECSQGQQLCKRVGERIYNLAGKLSIYGSAEVLKNSVCYVGNDSGVMHLAGVAGRPCVALFSARDKPGKWAPYGDSHQILRHDVECAGCMLEVCGLHGNKCMKLITVDEVFDAVCRILKSS